jgi:hypothetical protein
MLKRQNLDERVLRTCVWIEVCADATRTRRGSRLPLRLGTEVSTLSLLTVLLPLSKAAYTAGFRFMKLLAIPTSIYLCVYASC